MPGVEWFASSLNGLISDWGLGAYLGLALLVACLLYTSPSPRD